MFKPTAVVTSGSIDLLELFQWLMEQVVSTDSHDARFDFTDFSITSN